MNLRNISLAILLLFCGHTYVAAQGDLMRKITLLTNDSTLEYEAIQDPELLERLRNMPNIEVGKGLTFQPQNNLYKMTIRFRMQNLLALGFDKDFSLNDTEARVKRLRLRFDGYIFSPKLLYSIQLGFTSYDAKTLPNGNMNIVRDAMIPGIPHPDEMRSGIKLLPERPKCLNTLSMTNAMRTM